MVIAGFDLGVHTLFNGTWFAGASNGCGGCDGGRQGPGRLQSKRCLSRVACASSAKVADGRTRRWCDGRRSVAGHSRSAASSASGGDAGEAAGASNAKGRARARGAERWSTAFGVRTGGLPSARRNQPLRPRRAGLPCPGPKARPAGDGWVSVLSVSSSSTSRSDGTDSAHFRRLGRTSRCSVAPPVGDPPSDFPGKASTFPLMPAASTSALSVRYRTSSPFDRLIQTRLPAMRLLFVRPAVCFRLPSDPRLATGARVGAAGCSPVVTRPCGVSLWGSACSRMPARARTCRRWGAKAAAGMTPAG